MIISFSYPAGANTLWTKEAADSLVGQSFEAKLKDDPIGVGTIIGAHIFEDGKMISLTVEWPDDPTSERLLSQDKHVL